GIVIFLVPGRANSSALRCKPRKRLKPAPILMYSRNCLQKYSFQGHDAELHLKHSLRLVALLASVGWLIQGCAPLAPGFSSAGNDAASAVSPSGFSTADIDPPPAGALTEITPELIRAQRAATAQTTLGPEVMKLVGETGPYR